MTVGSELAANVQRLQRLDDPVEITNESSRRLDQLRDIFSVTHRGSLLGSRATGRCTRK